MLSHFQILLVCDETDFAETLRDSLQDTTAEFVRTPEIVSISGKEFTASSTDPKLAPDLLVYVTSETAGQDLKSIHNLFYALPETDFIVFGKNKDSPLSKFSSFEDRFFFLYRPFLPEVFTEVLRRTSNFQKNANPEEETESAETSEENAVEVPSGPEENTANEQAFEKTFVHLYEDFHRELSNKTENSEIIAVGIDYSQALASFLKESASVFETSPVLRDQAVNLAEMLEYYVLPWFLSIQKKIPRIQKISLENLYILSDAEKFREFIRFYFGVDLSQGPQKWLKNHFLAENRILKDLMAAKNEYSVIKNTETVIEQDTAPEESYLFGKEESLKITRELKESYEVLFRFSLGKNFKKELEKIHPGMTEKKLLVRRVKKNKKLFEESFVRRTYQQFRFSIFFKNSFPFRRNPEIAKLRFNLLKYQQIRRGLYIQEFFQLPEETKKEIYAKMKSPEFLKIAGVSSEEQESFLFEIPPREFEPFIQAVREFRDTEIFQVEDRGPGTLPDYQVNEEEEIAAFTVPGSDTEEEREAVNISGFEKEEETETIASDFDKEERETVNLPGFEKEEQEQITISGDPTEEGTNEITVPGYSRQNMDEVTVPGFSQEKLKGITVPGFSKEQAGENISSKEENTPNSNEKKSDLNKGGQDWLLKKGEQENSSGKNRKESSSGSGAKTKEGLKLHELQERIVQIIKNFSKYSPEFSSISSEKIPDDFFDFPEYSSEKSCKALSNFLLPSNRRKRVLFVIPQSQFIGEFIKESSELLKKSPLKNFGFVLFPRLTEKILNDVGLVFFFAVDSTEIRSSKRVDYRKHENKFFFLPVEYKELQTRFPKIETKDENEAEETDDSEEKFLELSKVDYEISFLHFQANRLLNNEFFYKQEKLFDHILRYISLPIFAAVSLSPEGPVNSFESFCKSKIVIMAPFAKQIFEELHSKGYPAENLLPIDSFSHKGLQINYAKVCDRDFPNFGKSNYFVCVHLDEQNQLWMYIVRNNQTFSEKVLPDSQQERYSVLVAFNLYNLVRNDVLIRADINNLLMRMNRKMHFVAPDLSRLAVAQSEIWDFCLKKSSLNEIAKKIHAQKEKRNSLLQDTSRPAYLQFMKKQLLEQTECLLQVF